LSDCVQRPEMHHHAKFSQNRSIHCRDIVIFQFFKMAAICHLAFLKLWNFIGWRVVESQDASPCQTSTKSTNPLQSYCNFLIFQDGSCCHLGFGSCCHLGFLKLFIFVDRCGPGGSICITMPNFLKIGQTIFEISQFFIFQDPFWISEILKFYYWRGPEGWDASPCQTSSKSVNPLQRCGDITNFSRWQPSAIMDLFGHIWTTMKGTWCLITVQNLVTIDAVQ